MGIDEARRALAAAEAAAGVSGERAVAAPVGAERRVGERFTGERFTGERRGSVGAPGPRMGGGQGQYADPYAGAQAIALRQLAMAPRSSSELGAKLRQKGCPDDVATVVIDRLTEVGLLDDAAYAQMLVHQRSSQRGLARSALRRELAGKGVDREVAEAAVGEVSEAAERLRAEELVAKKLRTIAGLDPTVQARRLAGMLQRKGYSSGLTYAVVRDAIAALPELERD